MSSPSGSLAPQQPPLRLALYQPEIAGNVGAILRTAACLGVAVDLIEPMGFAFSDRSLMRAGMDYVAHVPITRHTDWDAFEAAVTGRIVLFTTAGATPLPQARFAAGDTLLFGAESAGVPAPVHARADCRVQIPLRNAMRSLNISVAVAIGLAEGLRQLDAWPGGGA